MRDFLLKFIDILKFIYSVRRIKQRLQITALSEMELIEVDTHVNFFATNKAINKAKPIQN